MVSEVTVPLISNIDTRWW